RFRHGGDVLSVAFSADGKTLASGGAEGVRVWDVATGKQLRMWRGFATPVWSVAFSPDGGTLAAAELPNGPTAGERGIGLLSLVTGAQRRLKGFPSEAGGPLAFSRDGKTLAGFNRSGDVLLWDPASGAPQGVLPGRPSNLLRTAAFSPDGQTLACN